MTETAGSRRDARETVLAAAVLPLLVFAVYGRALGHGFVSDDHWLVETSPIIGTLDALVHLRSPFWLQWGSAVPYYRPAVTWTLALDMAAGGGAPFFFHLTNLLLHSAAAIALFLVARRFAPSEAALSAAAIFAVHPVQAESVAWVLGRTDLQAGLFVLLAAWAHAGVPDRPRGAALARYGAALAAFTLALLSKESAILFPAFAVGADLAAARAAGEAWRDAARRVLARLVRLGPGYIAVLAGYLVLRGVFLAGLAVGPGDTTMADPAAFRDLGAASPVARVLASTGTLARQVALVAFPRTLTFEIPFREAQVVRAVSAPGFLVSTLVLAAAMGLLIAAARRLPAAAFGAAVALSSFAFHAAVLSLGTVPASDRLLYLPMAGIAAAAGAALAAGGRRLGGTRHARLAVFLPAALLLVPLAVRAFVRTGDWRNDATLATATVRTAPGSASAWIYLARNQVERGKTEAALESLRRAEELAPGYYAIRVNRAEAYRKANRLDEAELELRGLLLEQPDILRAALLRCEVLGDLAEAEKRAGHSAAVRRFADDLSKEAERTAQLAEKESLHGVAASARLSRARALLTLGRREEAGRDLAAARALAERETMSRAAVGTRPFALLAAVLGESGAFERESGRAEEAVREFREAAAFAERGGAPEATAGMRANEGSALVELGRFEEAREAYRAALDLVHGNGAIARTSREGLARSLGALGDLDGALALANGSSDFERVATAAADGAAAGGHPAAALAIYDRVVAHGAPPMRVLHGRARAKRALGDRAGAEADLEAAAARSAGQPPKAVAEIWYEAGLLALERGDRAAARKRFERALRALPGHPGATRSLAEDLR